MPYKAEETFLEHSKKKYVKLMSCWWMQYDEPRGMMEKVNGRSQNAGVEWKNGKWWLDLPKCFC